MIVRRASPQATLLTSTHPMKLPEDKQKLLDQFLADAEHDKQILRESKEQGKELMDKIQVIIDDISGPDPEKIFFNQNSER